MTAGAAAGDAPVGSAAPGRAPAALGRGAIVGDGQPAPDHLSDAPRVRVDAAVLTEPVEVVDRLHRLWVARTPTVVELAVDPAALRVPQVSTAAVHDHDPRFEFATDRLRHLVWANAVDHRSPDGPPMWWHAVKAARALPGVAVGGSADVVLPDGRAAWVDGGPRQPLDTGDGAVVLHRDDAERGVLAPQAPRIGMAPQVPGTGTTPAAGAASAALEGLAPDQAAAVAASLGAVRVAAPAGSGKTRVLTARLHELIAVRGVPPEAVLALAYNTKAAAELRRRAGSRRVRAATVHSYALEVVRRHDGELEVLDEREVRRILGDLIEVPRRANADPLQPYIDALERVRTALVPPTAVDAEREDVEDLPRVFAAYRAHLARRRAVDFPEMVYRALELLLGDAAVREAEQARVGMVLVDEFQDLTPAYLLLIRLLSSPQLQCFGVGDDDQVIYGHAGATPEYLLGFDQLFPGAEDHPLTVNYRCPAPVVEGAVALLAHNRIRLDKAITPGPTAATTAIEAHRVHTTEQATAAGDAVARAVTSGATHDQIAVLARVRVALLGTQADLTTRGIPTRSPIGEWLLGRTGVRAALAYLRLAVDDRMDGEDLAEVLHRPLRPIPGAARDVLRGRRWTSEALRRVADTRFDGRTRRAVQDFVRDLDVLRARAARQPTAEILRHISDGIGLGEAAASLDASAGDQIASSHLDDLDALMQVADHCTDPVQFEPFLTGVVRQPPVDGPAVTLSTIHSVKGLEWPHVVVVGLGEGISPHRLAVTPTAIEEERRVFHVALTRASQHLVLVAPRSGTSRFVAEALGEPSLVGTAAAPRGGGRPARGSTSSGTAAGRAAPAKGRPAKAAAGPTRFRATVGLQVSASGGLAGSIEQITDDGALVRTAHGSLLRLKFGSEVRVDGAFGTLAKP